MIQQKSQRHKQHYGLFILSLSLLTMLLAGCGGGTNTFNARTGTQGLEITFLKNAPPEKVFEAQNFGVDVVVYNKGANDVEQGYLALSVEPDYMVLDASSDRQIEVAGKSHLLRQGDQIMKEFKVKSRQLENQSEYHISTVRATVCYPYQTILQTDVCIDTDPLSIKQTKKVCTPAAKSFSGQGAPVSVSKVEVQMLPQESEIVPQIVIYVKNVGKGQVVDLTKIEEACGSAPLAVDSFNKVNIGVVLGKDEMTCSPVPMKLRDKTDYVRCIGKPLPSSLGNYVTALAVKLNYGYTYTISKDVKIERILTH